MSITSGNLGPITYFWHHDLALSFENSNYLVTNNLPNGFAAFSSNALGNCTHKLDLGQQQISDCREDSLFKDNFDDPKLSAITSRRVFGPLENQIHIGSYANRPLMTKLTNLM
jgi:hypothetical protein